MYEMFIFFHFFFISFTHDFHIYAEGISIYDNYVWSFAVFVYTRSNVFVVMAE